MAKEQVNTQTKSAVSAPVPLGTAPIAPTPDHYDTDLGVVLKFVDTNWRQMLVTIASAGAIFYIAQTYINSRHADFENGADRLAEVHSLYAKIRSEVDSGKAKPEEIAAANEQLSHELSQLWESKSPYDKVAQVYRVLAATVSGEKGTVDQKKIEDLLVSLNPDAILSDTSKERQFGELALTTLGRTLLDIESQAKNGRALLYKVASQGQYAAVSAALSLARSSESKEEIDEAVQALKALSERQPYSASLLKTDLDKLSHQ